MSICFDFILFCHTVERYCLLGNGRHFGAQDYKKENGIIYTCKDEDEEISVVVPKVVLDPCGARYRDNNF